MKKAGKFIAFEGIDGSGKSSQVAMLKSKLEAAGHKVYCTFEPTDNKIGSLIRSIIQGENKADNRTIAALFAADRLHHLLNEQDGILKKLSEGYHVLCDRYYFSSYAYHSVHMDMDWVIEINRKSAEILRPDLNIFIDVKPAQAMQRIQQNRSATDLYETTEMLSAVYENYRLAFERMKAFEMITRIDGNDTPEAISTAIWQEIEHLL
jgi:dTMP kinase